MAAKQEASLFLLILFLFKFRFKRCLGISVGTVGSTDEKAPRCQAEFMIYKAD